MEIGNLVIITGPAAAGKSTIAKALQSELSSSGSLWLLVQMDTFADSLYRDWFTFDTHHAPYAKRGIEYRRDNDGGLQLIIGVDGRRALSAFHRSVAAIVKSGVSVVCETVVCDEEDWHDWSEVLEGIQTNWVQLSAPLAILEAREKADRPQVIQGLARGNLARKPVGQYDLELDTSTETIAVIVERIIDTLPG